MSIFRSPRRDLDVTHDIPNDRVSRGDGVAALNGRSLPVSNSWRKRIAGLEQEVPLLDGRLVPYINLDNAASTPPLQDVSMRSSASCRTTPASIGGPASSHASAPRPIDEAHDTIARFVGAETTTNTVIFGKNTTEAINKLAFRYPLGRRSVVLSTAMEHHSNDLPWRGRATVVRATVTA